MIKQFLEELHEEFPNNRITYNGEYAGAGNEWYEILFSVDKNGYSLLTNQYGA
jgi:isocitrate lyase